MAVRVRKSRETDLPAIMGCYDCARQYMRAHGNVSQWVNGYPSRELVLDDIQSSRSYVGVDDDDEIVMAFSFVIGPDPTYDVIENGDWLNNSVYGTIHRLGSTGKRKGMLAVCIDFCESMVDDLRLDTHEDNQTMRKGVEKLGFIRCGKIYCYDGTPRIAYHKVKNK